jgi:hypothetical protein
VKKSGEKKETEARRKRSTVCTVVCSLNRSLNILVKESGEKGNRSVEEKKYVWFVYSLNRS